MLEIIVRSNIMKQLRELMMRYKSLIFYGIFGVLTTIVNLACYQFLFGYLKVSNITSTVIAWLFAVIFAYITNRRLVFDSKNTGINLIMKELASFMFFRIATGVLDVAIMYVAVDIGELHALTMKLLSNVVVIIINYIASKLIIFKKR